MAAGWSSRQREFRAGAAARTLPPIGTLACATVLCLVASPPLQGQTSPSPALRPVPRFGAQVTPPPSAPRPTGRALAWRPAQNRDTAAPRNPLVGSHPASATPAVAGGLQRIARTPPLQPVQPVVWQDTESRRQFGETLIQPPSDAAPVKRPRDYFEDPFGDDPEDQQPVAPRRPSSPPQGERLIPPPADPNPAGDTLPAGDSAPSNRLRGGQPGEPRLPQGLLDPPEPPAMAPAAEPQPLPLPAELPLGEPANELLPPDPPPAQPRGPRGSEQLDAAAEPLPAPRRSETFDAPAAPDQDPGDLQDGLPDRSDLGDLLKSAPRQPFDGESSNERSSDQQRRSERERSPDETRFDDQLETPGKIDCNEFRQRIAEQTIDQVSLDISPPYRPDEIDLEKYDELKADFDERQPIRAWRAIDGAPIASGRLRDLAYEKAIIETATGTTEALPLDRLSEGDLAFIGEQWGLPVECLLEQSEPTPRQWTLTTMTWKASNLCHTPLYFQDVNLERYGHTRGPVLEPLVQTAHFFGNVIVLPYKMGVHSPHECIYTLGYYRPGNCAPWIKPPVPISAKGAITQAVTTTGLFWLIP